MLKLPSQVLSGFPFKLWHYILQWHCEKNELVPRGIHKHTAVVSPYSFPLRMHHMREKWHLCPSREQLLHWEGMD